MQSGLETQEIYAKFWYENLLETFTRKAEKKMGG
jgi:hypothetical protein